MIGLYETGARQPSLSNLIKLASIYKVSTDYLLSCENNDIESISLSGLTPQQIQALTLTLKCFRKEQKIPPSYKDFGIFIFVFAHLCN